MDLTALINDCACLKVRTAARAVTKVYDDAFRPVGLRATTLAYSSYLGGSNDDNAAGIALDRDGNVEASETLGVGGWQVIGSLAVSSADPADFSERVDFASAARYYRVSR
jgi:hypothetical protein